MIRAAIAGLGWWGKTLVEAVQGQSKEISFVAGATRTVTPEVQTFAKAQGFDLRASYDELLKDPAIDAVVLTTPNSMHLAGLTLALDYNRRFHPTIADLRERVRTGALGTILHFEGTVTFPNALYLKPGQWRADRAETPCGGLMPMGVHVIDAAIDLFGEVDEVYCQSFHRAVPVDADDTTSILFRMKNGMSGYLGTMTATAGGFRLHGDRPPGLITNHLNT